MKFDRKALLLYAVTDRSWLGERTLKADVEASLKGGVTLLQLREKSVSRTEFIAEAREIKQLCSEYGIPFIINDNVEVAIACGADGVHVGQHDMNARDVRALLGPDKLLGVSAQTVGQALLAERQGADYLGVGSVFTTSTKLDADSVSLETLKSICEAVSIPVVAIGGISADNAPRLGGTGIAGIAVVSAIYARHDIEGAARELYQLSCEVSK